jgi:CHAT domain-containing protein/hydrogenase maturation factor
MESTNINGQEEKRETSDADSEAHRCGSKAWLILTLGAFFVGTLSLASHKYIGLFLARGFPGRPRIETLRSTTETSNDPKTMLVEANRFAWLFNWSKAEPLYFRAEDLFRENGDTRNEIYARIGRIRAQSETMSWVDVSGMLARELEMPVVKQDPELKLWCLAAKGYTDLEINPLSAKRAWTEVRKIARTLGEAQWEARAEGELGIISFLEGDSRRAATLVGDALVSAMASGDAGGEVRLLEMLGNGFNEARRYGEALAFYERAIDVSRATPDAGFPFMAYEGESDALFGQGKVPEARDKLARALAAAKANQRFGHESVILVHLGDLAMHTGDRQAALEYLERSAELAHKYKFYRTMGLCMIDLAELQQDAGDLKAAEQSATIGVDASRRVGDRYYLPRDLTVLADLKSQRGAIAEAEALYENAEDVIAGMLVNLREAYWTSSLMGAMSETYLHHFELEARERNVKRALGVLERVRGRTLTALLQNKVSFSSDESDRAHQLEDTVSELQLQLMRSESRKERASLRDELIEYERRLELTRTEGSESTHAGYETPASLKLIQSTLYPDEAVLEYVLSEPRSYCLWITPRRVGLAVLPADRRRIEELARHFIDETKAKRNDVYTARLLYDALLAPLPRQAQPEKLIFVPDGVLHLFPVELVRDSRGALLLEHHTISYVPSSTVLTVLRAKSVGGPVPSRAFLGVGDVAYQDQGGVSGKLAKPSSVSRRLLRLFSDTLGMPLYDLPNTRQEVLSARRLLDPYGSDGVVVLGLQATETAFKSEPLTDFKIIHLATHGFSDAQFPERSGLVLGVDPNSNDDGLLQVREILRLRFRADLVTLSACDTGVGKLQGEEGMSSLVEAFLISGAKAVVASLWTADDTYTLDLMERFYTHIAQGQDKAGALRQAKLDLLVKYGKDVSPYYWGAFVLVGDGGSPIRLSVQ